jgi:hypothetical protein
MNLMEIKLMLTIKTLRTALCLLIFLPTISLANTVEKIDFKTYSDKVSALNAACKERALFGFSGFCLTREYGPVAYRDPTQTSITLGMGIATFERFYSACEHSDFSPVGDLLTKAKTILESKKFLDEIRPQEEGLNNYLGRFYPCGSKGENDAAILSQIKWFVYMIQTYSAPR